MTVEKAHQLETALARLKRAAARIADAKGHATGTERWFGLDQAQQIVRGMIDETDAEIDRELRRMD